MSIRSILMERDSMSDQEAKDLIDEARKVLYEYIAEGDLSSAYEICAEYFGLEADYLMELL